MSSSYHTRKMAGGPGIEPGFTDPKSVVLPLDDPPAGDSHLTQPVFMQSRPIPDGCGAPTRDHPILVPLVPNEEMAGVSYLVSEDPKIA